MCWDGHVPVYRHRDAWANEHHAPSLKEFEKISVVSSQETPDQSDSDILVVASKVKAFIRKTSGMNTSDSVIQLLSHKVRKMCEQGIEKAKADSRQTLLDRDIGR